MKTENRNRTTWSLRNADIDSFQNGDAIPEAKTNEQWFEASENKKPAWCSASDASDDNKLHGNLYNWYAITDKRGFAPKGWTLPSEEDLESLLSNQNGSKSELELPKVGLRSYVNGKRYSMDTAGYYWSRTPVASEFAKAFMFNEGDAVISHTHKGNGYSVRFIKDIPAKKDLPVKKEIPIDEPPISEKPPTPKKPSAPKVEVETTKNESGQRSAMKGWVIFFIIIFIILILMNLQ